MTEERLRDRDGTIVRIQGDTWIVPIHERGIVQTIDHRFNWSSLPQALRRSTAILGRLVVEYKGVRVYSLFAHGIRYLGKYLVEGGCSDLELTALTETDWGSFAEWLESHENSLALDTRRGYFTGIRLALRLAADMGLEGYFERNLESIEVVMRRRFRDANLLKAQRSAKRAWSEKERDILLEILRLEWLKWKDYELNNLDETLDRNVPDLLAVVAVYLCWEESVRPEEINALTVDDIDLENSSMFLHAPNKEAGWIGFDQISRAMLTSLIAYGEDARQYLGNRALFVCPMPKARIIGSRELTKRLRRILVKYSATHPINRFDAKLSDGRKTLGSTMAARTEDKETVRLALRHKGYQTLHIYYVRQGKEQLSRNVTKALRSYATRLSMAYNRPSVTEDDIPEEMKSLLDEFPDHQTPYGPCTNEEVLKNSNHCELGIHCGECPKLIPMASKIENFKRERDMYLQLAQKDKEAGHIRGHENRMATAGMLEGHIMNIERTLKGAVGNG